MIHTKTTLLLLASLGMSACARGAGVRSAQPALSQAGDRDGWTGGAAAHVDDSRFVGPVQDVPVADASAWTGSAESGLEGAPVLRPDEVFLMDADGWTGGAAAHIDSAWRDRKQAHTKVDAEDEAERTLQRAPQSAGGHS